MFLPGVNSEAINHANGRFATEWKFKQKHIKFPKVFCFQRDRRIHVKDIIGRVLSEGMCGQFKEILLGVALIESGLSWID
jgi:hypothetical protein